MTRYVLKLALVACVLVAVSRSAEVRAQEFLCSAGSNDGGTCAADQDCPGGVCVTSQGVCNGGTTDGQPCECTGGQCNTSPICSTDATMGTCAGGIFSGLCCDPSYNCDGSTPCVATQKVCLSGSQKGFSCLNNAQCPGSTCASTGKFCDAGDFQDYTCVDDADCPNGHCVSQIPEPTPTATPRPITPTRTRTRTRTPTGVRSVIPTPTPSPVTPGVPTLTPVNTEAARTETPNFSPTPTVFTGPRLDRDLSAEGTIVVLDDGSSLPGDRATVQIDDEQIYYLIRDGNTLESLVRGANGTTPAAHLRFSPVYLVEGLPTPTTRPKHTATPGPASVVYQANGNGAGCAVVASGDGGGLVVLGVAAALGFAFKRRR